MTPVARAILIPVRLPIAVVAIVTLTLYTLTIRLAVSIAHDAIGVVVYAADFIIKGPDQESEWFIPSSFRALRHVTNRLVSWALCR
jgi:hypothetical protein